MEKFQGVASPADAGPGLLQPAAAIRGSQNPAGSLTTGQATPGWREKPAAGQSSGSAATQAPSPDESSIKLGPRESEAALEFVSQIGILRNATSMLPSIDLTDDMVSMNESGVTSFPSRLKDALYDDGFDLSDPAVARVASIALTVGRSELGGGRLPEPELLANYEKVVPGSALRIVDAVLGIYGSRRSAKKLRWLWAMVVISAGLLVAPVMLPELKPWVISKFHSVLRLGAV